MVKEFVDSAWKVRGEEILSNLENIGKVWNKKKAAFLPPRYMVAPTMQESDLTIQHAI